MRRSNLSRFVLYSAGITLIALTSACQPIMNDEGNNPPDSNPASSQVMPSLSAQSHAGFHGYYTRLSSSAPWEPHQFVGNYADVVVNFSENQQLQFWRGSSYLPLWQTAQGASYAPQLFKTQGDGTGLRWDKLNRHSHVRIISQSDSEVVVHWRYAPIFDTGVNPMTPGWTGWVDEYYRIAENGTINRDIYDHNKKEKTSAQLKLNDDGTISTLNSTVVAYTPNAPAFNSATLLPSGDDAGFGAQYTKLGYSGSWDRGPNDGYQPPSSSWNQNWQTHDHPDVVVNFDDNKTKWVFWRGLGFVPSMVSENDAWFTNEFNETWGWSQMCDEGGAEPMNDKQARYSHVRIIENTAARIVIHWRYHPTGVCYNLIDTQDTADGWGAASDFVFYIYPDGSTLSKNTLHSKQANTYGGDENGFEYHEAIVINSAGKHPWDNIEIRDSVSVLNLEGESASYHGENGGINDIGEDPFPLPIRGNITRVNLKDTAYDTFTIMEHGDTLEIMPYWEMDFTSEYPNHHFVRWDHWPVNQIRAFGRSTDTAKYPSHTSLFHMAFNPPYAQGKTSQTRLLLTGVSNINKSQVVNLANAWLEAPSVESLTGANDAHFDQSQRAYVMSAKTTNIQFTLAATNTQPVHNPAFIINDWQGTDSQAIRVNGQSITNAKQGIVYNHEGKRTLVLFIPWESSSAMHISLLP